MAELQKPFLFLENPLVNIPKNYCTNELKRN